MTAIIFPILFSIIVRLTPFFQWGEFPLGADAGIYLKDFSYIPPSLLYSFHLFVSVGIGIALYYYMRRYGAGPALATLIIYSVSLAQFVTYWLVYAKMSIAILLTILVWWLVVEERWLFIIPVMVVINLIHPLVSLPLFITVGGALAFARNRFFAAGSVAAAGIAAIAINHEALQGFLFYAREQNSPGTLAPLLAGHFIDIPTYLLYASLSLILGIAGALIIIRKKIHPVPLIYTVVNGALVASNIVFANRFLILFDIGLATLAGIGLYAWYEWTKKAWIAKIVTLGILALAAGTLIYQSWSLEPVVTAAELQEIKTLGATEPNALIISTDPIYYPVLYAYSKRTVYDTVVAPRTPGEPLYFYIGRRTTTFDRAPHEPLVQVSERIWKSYPQK